MIKALLFDLDDTLLSTTLDTFLPGYFKALTAKLHSLIPPDRLTRQILASTQLMVQPPHPDQTNQEVFSADFFSKIGIQRETLEALFDEFYACDFSTLRALTRPKPEARGIMSAVFREYSQVVIATQPVFPLTAIRQRMEWAGVAGFPYTLITSYENMHACKPSRAYYLEIVAYLRLEPQECLMIGNDLQQDIRPAALAGLRTCWITESGETDVACDWQGTLMQLGDMPFRSVQGQSGPAASRTAQRHNGER